MKVLCVCNHGNVRSVGLAYLIKTVYKGEHDVLTAGVEENSPETLKMLWEWADGVVYLTPEAKQYFLTVDAGTKSVFIDVGDDTWHNPFDQRLQHRLLKHLKELDL